MNMHEHLLLGLIAKLPSLDECLGFRMQLTEQGEYTGLVKATLEKRIAAMVKK